MLNVQGKKQCACRPSVWQSSHKQKQRTQPGSNPSLPETDRCGKCVRLHPVGDAVPSVSEQSELACLGFASVCRLHTPRLFSFNITVLKLTLSRTQDTFVSTSFSRPNLQPFQENAKKILQAFKKNANCEMKKKMHF